MRWGTSTGRASVGRRHRRDAAPAATLAAAIVAAFLFWVLAAPALAQQSAAQPPTVEAPPVTAAEIDSLVRTLEDPTARERLIEQLRALKAAQARVEEAEAPADGIGADLLAGLSGQVGRIGGAVGVGIERLSDLPELIEDIVAQAGDPEVRGRWLDFLVKIAIALAAGAVAQWLVKLLLARPRRALENQAGASLWLRIPLLIGRAIVDLVPIAAFAAAAYLVLPLTDPRVTTRLVALAFINAHIVARVVVILARVLLAPRVSALRIVPLSDENAHYALIWVQRLTVVATYGYFLIEAALLLGLARGAYELLLRILGLVIGAMLVVLILQNRAPVAAWLRNGGAAAGRLGQLRRRFADVWHILAIGYVVAFFAVWALDVPGGFAFLVRATLLTFFLLLLLRLVIAGLRRALARGFRLSAELKSQFPNLEARANRYLPILERVLEVAVYLVAALALLEIWGLHGFAWLETEFGRRILGSTLAILLILGGAVLLSELVGLFIERYLERTDGTGAPVARSARVRTLLPLLRNAFRVVLAVVVVMIVLAELGVNIGPLLAAAGVAGLAIGFGAQTLVQDIITGGFILAEDSISIGDVVEVDGHSGLVEAMTIRTLRLRDLSGTVHTIPFSAVKTIKNLTKEFSYALFDVRVAYREDVDAVIEVLKEIAAGLQADDEFGPKILAPMEVLGLDQFRESDIIIRARIKTLPLQQWGIMREFNRRMKRAFDEKGIEIPVPHRRIYFGEDRQGQAPPARIRVEPADAESPQGRGKEA